MNTLYWISLAAVIGPSILVIGWLIFRSWAGFRESVWYDFMPDIISLLKGELKRDWLSELKVALFVVSCLIVAAMEKKMVDGIFGLVN